jgi:large subunit ribosomal protein L9
MKVLLLQDTKNLGKKYEIVTVNDGFAQNNLFPKKIALPAKSAEALKIINDKEKNTTFV